MPPALPFRIPMPRAAARGAARRARPPGRAAAGALLAGVAAVSVCAAAWAAPAGGSGSPAGIGRTVSWTHYAQASGLPELPPGAPAQVQAAPPIPPGASAVRLSDIAGRARVAVDPTLPAVRDQPRLEQADVRASVARALENSFDLAGARSRSLAQQYQIDVARGAQRTRIDLRAAGGMENASPSARIDPVTGTPLSSSTHGRDDTALVLRQPLYDLGARREQERQQALFGSTQAGVAVTRDQVTVDAASAHLDVLQFALTSEFAQEYRAELEKLFALVNARVEAGGASPAEAERVKARAIGARSSVIEAGGSLESALLTYRRLVGAVPGTILADDVLAPSALPPLDVALERAKAINPTLTALRQNLRAVEAEVDAAAARLQPRLELEVGNYRTRGASGAPISTNEARAMVVLSWNLLAGGADIAARKAALARFDDSRYRILDAERRIDESLRISYNTLAAVEQRARSVREEFVANRRVVDAFRAQLASGNRPLLDVLDAEQRLYQSRVELLRLTVLQATLTMQALRQIGMIDGASADGEPGPAGAPAGASRPADAAPANTAPPVLPPAPRPPASLPAAPVPQATPPAPSSATPPATPLAEPVPPAAPSSAPTPLPDAPAAPARSPAAQDAPGDAPPVPAERPPALADRGTPAAEGAPGAAAERIRPLPAHTWAVVRGALPGVRTPAQAAAAAAAAGDAGAQAAPAPSPGGPADSTALARADGLGELFAALVAMLRAPAAAAPALPTLYAGH